MLSSSHGKPHAKEENTKLTRLHSVYKVLQLLKSHPGINQIGFVNSQALDQRPKHPKHFKIFSRLDLKKDIRCWRTFSPAHIDQNHSAIFPTIGNKQPLRHGGIPAPMSGMRLCRIGPPKNHKVCTIANLTQRTGYFAHPLKCHSRWTMTNRSGGINRSPDPIRDSNSNSLSLTGGIRKPINNREFRID